MTAPCKDLSLRLLSVCSTLTELSCPTFTAQTACAAPAAAEVSFEITFMTCARTPEHYCWVPLPVPTFLAHQSLICTNSYTQGPNYSASISHVSSCCLMRAARTACAAPAKRHNFLKPPCRLCRNSCGMALPLDAC